ncbi:hypothetical protein ABFX02_14G179900 [Erythranthe guttata]
MRRPHFNPHQYNGNNQQLQNNGVNLPPPQQQVFGNQGNFGPNPMQMGPQFQMGMLNNPQLGMPPFNNPNAYFPQPQFFPFPQGPMQNLNANNLAQLLVQNAVNLPQFLPNGQMGVPNLMQNVNQLLHMQMANSGLQNPRPFGNGQLGMGMPNGNGLNNMNQNAAATNVLNSPQVQHSQNAFSPGAANSQNNAGFVNGVNDRNNGWKKSHDKNHKHDASQRGFGKKPFQNRQNAQGNFKFNENRGKGNQNAGGKNFNFSNSNEQNHGVQKRSIALNYTEQEIQQWREERKRNFPSNANIEKKLKVSPTKPEVTEEVAKIRRQQLKEILAKQAELGCEVAEIPSCYLSDSELQTDGRQQNNKPFDKRDRFHNKFDKRGKFDQNNRFSKRQRYENGDSTNLPNQNDQFSNNQRWANGPTNNPRRENKVEQSLLKKLLSSDIKKDKKHLLQVFRFMVMNSFFENNLSETPLKFPEVVVRESCDGSAIVEEKSQAVKGDIVGSVDFDDISTGEAASTSGAYAGFAGDRKGSPREIGEISD